MGSIGEVLKQAREKRGVSIADVQSATKITPQNLTALEEDRLDAFPNRVYARAFLRDYANFLGLDTGPLLEQYELRWSPPEEQRTKSQPAAKPPDGAASLVRAFAIVIILVIVGLAVWRPLARAVQDYTKPKKPVVVTQPKPEPAATKPMPAPASKPTPTPKPVLAGVGLVVDVLTPSWIRVAPDGQPPFEGIVGAGKQMKWHANHSIVFRTGNAGGVRLTVNGVKKPQLGPAGRIAKAKYLAPLPAGAPAPSAGQPMPHP